MATLARIAGEDGQRTIVVTGDLDMLQIVDDTTTVLDHAPRHHRSRPLRCRGGARALRPRAAPAAGLPRAQRRSVRQLARHPGRRREDRDQAGQSGRLARRAARRSETCGYAEARSARARARRDGARFAATSRSSSAICRWRSTGAPRSSRSRRTKRSTTCTASSSSKRCSPNSRRPPIAAPVSTDELLQGAYVSYVAATDPPDFVQARRTPDAKRRRRRGSRSRCAATRSASAPPTSRASRSTAARWRIRRSVRRSLRLEPRAAPRRLRRESADRQTRASRRARSTTIR